MTEPNDILDWSTMNGYAPLDGGNEGGDECCGMQKYHVDNTLEVLRVELESLSLQPRQRVAHMLYMHLLVVPFPLDSANKQKVLACLGHTQNEAVSTEVTEELAANLMVMILNKVLKKGGMTSRATHRDSQASTMAEPGSQASLPESSASSGGNGRDDVVDTDEAKERSSKRPRRDKNRRTKLDGCKNREVHHGDGQQAPAYQPA